MKGVYDLIERNFIFCNLFNPISKKCFRSSDFEVSEPNDIKGVQAVLTIACIWFKNNKKHLGFLALHSWW